MSKATVKFNCPTAIIANKLAILAESGELQRLVNEALQDNGLLEGNELLEDASPDFDDSDSSPNHEIDLELAH
jgi:DNA-directed RNA polymerase specialized sigma54-like protein